MRTTRVLSSLLFVLGLMQSGAGQSSGRWPLDGDIDLSSGFGDYRENRFHAGIDLRTGGQVGKKVAAPVDGYVLRIKTSFTGYGRALYFKGSDGYIYVFGHLSAYFPALENRLHAAQVTAERYYQDISFPDDSIPIKKGELIAYSGETGAGAPHLHFEKRTANNIPLNPLTHGFDLPDKTVPVFTEIGFQLVDDHSLLQNGRRELYLPVSGNAGKYRLDTVLYFNAPFGLLAECYDMMNPQGMKQAPYKLSVSINDSLYYQSVFDSLAYEQSDAAKLEYDYFKATDGEKRVRRLFYKQGDIFSGSRSSRIGKGVFGLEQETPGTKQVVITAEDAFGNVSRLSFTFVWGPLHALFALDSMRTAEPDTTRFFFSPTVPQQQIKIDSIFVLLNRLDQWGQPSNSTVVKQDSGRYTVIVQAQQTKSAVLQLFAFTAAGATVCDTLFNGIHDNGSVKLSLIHDFVDGGMLVAIDSRSKIGSQSRVELYYHDSLLGIEYARFFTVQRQIAFIPAQAKYRHITSIGIAQANDPKVKAVILDSLNIFAIGVNTEQTFSVDDRFTIRVRDTEVYTPQFMELKKIVFSLKGMQGIVSDNYKIFPEKILTRAPFELQYTLLAGQSYNPYVGLCWLDSSNNAWVWLDNEQKKNVVSAGSYGGGSFAAVIDMNPPEIEIYGIQEHGVYSDRKPRFRFTISDDLSGIEDDRNISVKVDSKWVPAEYDTEKKMCTVQLTDPLSDGDHHLGIIVTDRVGRRGEKYMIFTIKGLKGQ